MAGRRLHPEEAALWARVVASVRPLDGAAAPAVVQEGASAAAHPAKAPVPTATAAARTKPGAARPGETLDGSWDRRLSRGTVSPDRSVDLHGHTLAGAHAALDAALADAVASGARVLLLVTGKPPARRAADGEFTRRGAIRAAVGDWLAVSRHAAHVAAVRNAHPRHGGAGALYIVLRRKREVAGAPSR